MRFFPGVLRKQKRGRRDTLTVVRLNDVREDEGAAAKIDGLPPDFRRALSKAAADLDRTEQQPDAHRRLELALQSAHALLPGDGPHSHQPEQQTEIEPAEPVPFSASAAEEDIPACLDGLLAADREMASNLICSFVECSPPVFDRLIAAVDASDWTSAGEAARELRAGPGRLLIPGLGPQLENVEAACGLRSLDFAIQSIEPAFAIYHAALITTRHWMAQNASLLQQPVTCGEA